MLYPWQQSQWRQLQQAIQRQRLPHALLLTGPSGTGKCAFSDELSRSLLCEQPDAEGQACGSCHSCKLLDAGNHPDFMLLKPAPPKTSKSDNPVLSIKIDAVRELIERLSTTSQMQGRRVAVIEQADKMAHAAANSLLKTLEEPGEDTVLILHSARPHLIPITIRSRCQKLAFPIPERRLALDWLQQQGVSDAENRLAQAHGAPLLAVDDEPSGKTVLDAAGREAVANAMLARARRQSALMYAAELAKLPKYPALSCCLDWVSDIIKLKTAADTSAPLVNTAARKSIGVIAAQADSARLFRFYDSLCEAIRQESIALNPQLLWESLLISWDEV